MSETVVHAQTDVVLTHEVLAHLEAQLVADGDSVFSATAASGAIRTARNATLQQGALEGSNVNLGEEMAKMATAQQEYAMGSQAIQYQSQMLSIADQIKP